MTLSGPHAKYGVCGAKYSVQNGVVYAGEVALEVLAAR